MQTEAAERYLGLLSAWPAEAAGPLPVREPALCGPHRTKLKQAARRRRAARHERNASTNAPSELAADSVQPEAVHRLPPAREFVFCSRCTGGRHSELCLPHLRAITRASTREAADEARQGFLALAEHVLAALAEQIRLADYRFRDEPRGPAHLPGSRV